MEEFLQPVNVEQIAGVMDQLHESSIARKISIYTHKGDLPDLHKAQIAIIGVSDDRNSVGNKGCGLAPDVVREQLYKLFAWDRAVNIVDLGNIAPGNSVNDTYVALKTVLGELLYKEIVPIIIGGGQDLTYANYLAYEKIEQTINLVSVDNRFDLGTADMEMSSQCYLGKIVLHQPNHLFNYSNLGYQSYYVDEKSTDLISKLFFDAYRLGHVRSHIEETEPVVRNADVLSFDVSAIRQSDAPGSAHTGPHGFYGEEACQIARYAGMSDKLTSFGIYEYNPKFDQRAQTAQLISHMIWYFVDGFCNRKHDFPLKDDGSYLKYHVAVQEHEKEVVFYKSQKSDRWWMTVPYPLNKKLKYERHHLVPCTFSDYETACGGNLPERWWQTYQKLS